MKRFYSLLLLGLVVTLSAVPGPRGEAANQEVARAEKDWPVFRGNMLQTGVSASDLPANLKVRWQFKTKDGVECTAAIVAGTVYIGSFDQQFYALDLASGREKWRYKAGPFKTPAAVRDGFVYIGDEDGIFHCLDARTGQKRWTFATGSEVTSGASFTGDHILFGAANETLYCLSSEGKEIWKFRVEGGPVHATPAVASGRTFVAGCDSNLHLIDVKTGKQVKAVELAGQVGATAGVVGDMLYIGTMTNEVQAIDLKQGKVQWTFRPEKRAQPFFASVAVTDKLVIAGSKDKRVYGLDRQTGKEVWSFLTQGRVEASPVVVGKRVYAASLDGHLYVLDHDTGRLLQKIELDGAIIGSPAVASGRLVIGTEKGTVYCLGE